MPISPGFHQSENGLGTGADDLRERLQLIFGDAAHPRLTSGATRGGRGRSRYAGTHMNAHATAMIADDEPLLRERQSRNIAIGFPREPDRVHLSTSDIILDDIR